MVVVVVVVVGGCLDTYRLQINRRWSIMDKQLTYQIIFEYPLINWKKKIGLPRRLACFLKEE